MRIQPRIIAEAFRGPSVTWIIFILIDRLIFLLFEKFIFIHLVRSELNSIEYLWWNIRQIVNLIDFL